MPTTTFPRSRNGYVDNGEQVQCVVGQKCPNCGSSQYKQTISAENCSACGLQCDYWGGGANKTYQDMMARDARLEEERRYLEELKEEDRSREDDVD